MRLLLLTLLLGGLSPLPAADDGAPSPGTYDFDCQDMSLEAKRLLVIDSHSHDVGMSKSLNDGMKKAIGEHGTIAMYEHYNLYACNKPNVLPTSEDIEYLQSINVAGNALLSLINDVLDITKLDANKLHLNLMDLNLLKLIIEVISMFKLKAIEKKLSLDYSCFGLELRTLSLDGPRLRQVLFNLIGNCVKFTRQEGVKVRSEFAPNHDGKAGQLAIRIIDYGPGIAPEQQKHIFDPFVQDASVERSFNNEGTGLGLAISRRLVEQMNGKLTLASTPGKGSSFIISLPDVPFTLNEDQDDDLASRVIVDHGRPIRENETVSYTILAVDDVALNLKVLGAVLRRLNHTCLLAASAEEAIRLLQDGADVDMVFTDMWMPNMNGQQLAEHLKANDRFRNLPVIAVTADVQVADTQNTPLRRHPPQALHHRQHQRRHRPRHQRTRTAPSHAPRRPERPLTSRPPPSGKTSPHAGIPCLAAL